MSDKTYARIRATGQLPSPTGVSLELMRLADCDDTTAASITPVVESDPATAARLIKIANSPAGGRTRSVASVHQAVTLLGLRTVKIIALGFSLVSTNRSGKCAAFDYDTFWAFAVARAASARHLCHRLKALNPDEGFTLGLLSQVGRLALATVFPARYAQALNTINAADPQALSQMEEKVFEVHPDELTALMVQDWGMPVEFCDALRRQSADDLKDLKRKSGLFKLVMILRVAGLMAHILVRREASLDELSLLAETAKQLDLDKTGLHEVFDAVSEKWQEDGQMLDIATRHAITLSTLTAMAEERQVTQGEQVQATPRPKPVEPEPDPVSEEELLELKAAVNQLNELQGAFDAIANQHASLVDRHTLEMEALQHKQTTEREPIDAAYAQAYDELINAKQAAIRLDALSAVAT